jgi:hypothetical protein
MDALGPELGNKVNRCTLDAGRITVVTESSAWAARLRFALAEVEPRLKELVPGFKELVVRITPASPPRKR